jgi:hypothetical protein
MLDVPVLLCMCLYTKIQTAIKGIVDCYTQDAYKLNEAKRMHFGFSTEYKYIILLDWRDHTDLSQAIIMYTAVSSCARACMCVCVCVCVYVCVCVCTASFEMARQTGRKS